MFKSFSDKKDSAKNSGGGGSASGSLTGRIRRSLFKENSTENETIEIVQVHTASFWNITIQWTSHNDLTEEKKSESFFVHQF